MDPSTSAFLESLITQPGDKRILFLFSARTSFKPTWTPPEDLVEIPLEPLSADAVNNIIARTCDGKLIPDAVLEQIVSKTDGVPLFVEELTKMVLESGQLEEKNGRFELVGNLPRPCHPHNPARLTRGAP